MKMNEAIEVLSDFDKQVSAKADGAYQSTIGEMACKVAINALEEIQQYRKIGTVKEVMELKEQNIALRNRCKIFTKGQLCIFCPIRCEERAEEYRNAEGSGEE